MEAKRYGVPIEEYIRLIRMHKSNKANVIFVDVKRKNSIK